MTDLNLSCQLFRTHLLCTTAIQWKGQISQALILITRRKIFSKINLFKVKMQEDYPTFCNVQFDRMSNKCLGEQAKVFGQSSSTLCNKMTSTGSIQLDFTCYGTPYGIYIFSLIEKVFSKVQVCYF